MKNLIVSKQSNGTYKINGALAPGRTLHGDVINAALAMPIAAGHFRYSTHINNPKFYNVKRSTSFSIAPDTVQWCRFLNFGFAVVIYAYTKNCRVPYVFHFHINQYYYSSRYLVESAIYFVLELM